MVLMTRAAFHGGDAVSIDTTPHIHGVPVAVVSLPREISG
jgi:hypothetical protein